MTALSDNELLSRTSRGDREAFGQLVVRHQSLVCAVAYSIVGDLTRSEEVAQDAFVAGWKQLGQLHDCRQFRVLCRRRDLFGNRIKLHQLFQYLPEPCHTAERN